MTDGTKELTAKEIAARFAAIGKGTPGSTEVVDDAARAELERWFGLPSFEQAAESPPPPADPEMAAVRERRDAAMAAVDPALVAALRVRTDSAADMLRFTPTIDVRVDPDVALFDPNMAARTIAEPRELELPPQMQDDLAACTPQALLRDLHRPELTFDKTFEIVDAAAELRVDAVAVVADAMRTSCKLPPLGASPAAEARALIAALRAERRQSWPALFASHPLPNRRVSG